ncbi:MAG: DUF2075 domain-containing protein [Planctomycetes bacterium]|nr:DUF2075 domain-containing protein [Planctomycetota bacterium]
MSTNDGPAFLPGAGWVSDLPTFRATAARVVRLRLASYVGDPGESQIRAWDHWIPRLQAETGALLACDAQATDYTAILEYTLPRDLRRPDVIVLENGVVVVLELKGDPGRTRAGLDQVMAYARDLRTYHAHCHGREVAAVLVVPSGPESAEARDGVWVVAPAGLHPLLARLSREGRSAPLTAEAFLEPEAYAPLPTIVAAARDLFETGDLPRIHRARARTEPALQAITAIAREAAATSTRRLVVLTGVPGSGKTLVGLQLVHARWLDGLAVPRASGTPTAPAVFLSGNGPLVLVLQHALARAGGGGKTFVQDVKKYVQAHLRPGRVPPEHVVVFDEAQRAHDAERVSHVHEHDQSGRSEPQHLLDFMERVPGWSVLVALVGTGQAIHVGEEGGLPLWAEALRGRAGWTVHAPAGAEDVLRESGVETRWDPALNLDTEIRQHLVPRVHEFVAAIVDGGSAEEAAHIAAALFDGGHRLLLTRELDAAREYVRERYRDATQARYGMLASSKDKVLPDWGVDNTFQATKQLRVGPWFDEGAEHPLSCCRLDRVATEFQAQGLELDFAVLCWGSDYLRRDGAWSNARSRGTRGTVRDPLGLRRNSYRVLLTRGRDGTLVYLPASQEFDETAEFLQRAGFRTL